MKALSPVAGKICLEIKGEDHLDTLYGQDFQRLDLDSGTACLAMAIAIAKTNSTSKNPKVIIPGYCCPDLLSAAIFSGTTPVAIDTYYDSPFYDEDQLAKALDDDVVAIVAVNLLGLRQPLNGLRQLCGSKACLIVDNAQAIPSNREELADMVIYSYGRGKPAPLIGGGSLLLRKSLCWNTSGTIYPPSTGRKLDFYPKALAYTLTTEPLIYGFLKTLPNSLGKTEYKKLSRVEYLDSTRRKRVGYNLHYNAGANKRRINELRQGIAALAHITDLSLSDQDQHLLRYPILLPNEDQRVELFKKPQSDKLGISPFYGTAISDVPGIPKDKVITGDLSRARAFARRLVTLPLHHHVSSQDIANIMALLEAQ